MTRRIVDADRILQMVRTAMEDEGISGLVYVRSGTLTGTTGVGRPSKHDVTLDITLKKTPHERKPK